MVYTIHVTNGIQVTRTAKALVHRSAMAVWHSGTLRREGSMQQHLGDKVIWIMGD